MLLLLMFTSLVTKGEVTIREIVDIQDKAQKERRLKDVIDYGKIALESYRNGNTDTLLWEAFDLGGNASVESRRFIEALEFYMASVEFGERIKHTRSKTLGLNNIGNIYESFGDYERGLHYYMKSYESAKANGDKYMMAASTLNLVNIYSLLDDIDKAKEYYTLLSSMTLHTPEETSFWKMLSRVSIALAEKDYDNAINYSKNSRDIAEKNNFRKDLIALTFDRTIKGYIGLNEPDSVLYYTEKIIDDPNSIDSYPDLLINAYNAREKVYEKMEIEDSINKYKFLSVQLSDSIYNRRKFNAANDLLYKYEDEEIQNHIYNLNDHIYNLNDQIHFKNIWIIIVVFALFIVVIILILINLNNRRLKKANELLISKNKDLFSQSLENQKLREQVVELYEKLEAPGKKGYKDESSDEESNTINLSEQKVLVLLRDITRVMQNPMTISDPSFNQAQLARLVNSNTSYVSMVINNSYKKNFKTYLNEYRINLAAERLLENKKYTIQYISESVGFKSTSNFIATFKKIMGMNPSEYRKLS